MVTSAHGGSRLLRRIPVGCNGLLRPHDGQEAYSARCLEIDTGGMTLETDYVPRLAEELDALIHPPDGGAAQAPLHVRVEVKRCHRAPSGHQVLAVQVTKVLE